MVLKFKVSNRQNLNIVGNLTSKQCCRSAYIHFKRKIKSNLISLLNFLFCLSFNISGISISVFQPGFRGEVLFVTLEVGVPQSFLRTIWVPRICLAHLGFCSLKKVAKHWSRCLPSNLADSFRQEAKELSTWICCRSGTSTLQSIGQIHFNVV